MRCIKPPTPLPAKTSDPIIFLAGTIDNGAGIEWQNEVCDKLRNTKLVFLNPRRAAWDPSLKPTISEPLFKQQVEWELHGMELADCIFLYFAPGSKSPISLLELGLFAKSGKLIVCCPEGFWRKGNVDYICDHFGLATVPDLATGIEYLRQRSSIL
jgi:hypothetical protein